MIAALKMNRFFVILVILVQSAAHGFSQMEFTIGLFDGGRNRVVPVTVYQPERESSETKVIIFNHGFGGKADVATAGAFFPYKIRAGIRTVFRYNESFTSRAF